VNADALREGLTVEVDLGWETEHALVFEGVIRQVRPSAQEGSHRIEVIAYDPSIRLQAPPREPNVARQHVGTLEAILRAIVERHQITFGAVQIDPMPSWTENDPLRQGLRTDWVFIQDLAEEYRARAFVEVNATPSDAPDVRQRGGRPRFYFTSEDVLLSQEPLGKLMYCRGMGRLLDFQYQRVSSGASPSSSTTVTNPETGEPETVEGAPPTDAPPPQASDSRASRAEAVQGAARARDYQAGVQASADAEVHPDDVASRREVAGLPSSPELAERLIRQDRTRILGFSGRGTAMGTVFLRAKGSVEIQGLATWAAGRWYAHRVNHLIQRQRSGKKTQLTYRTQFEATR
jgi:hypothetical protein